MKLSKLPILVLAAAALAGSGCSRDDFGLERDNYGTLSIALAASNSLTAGDITRATGEKTIAEALGVAFDPASFLSSKGGDFTITIEDSNEQEKYSGKLSAFDTATKFDYGTYTIKAVYDPATVGFYGDGGEPSFASDEVSFAINAATQDVTIPVALSNSILRVEYTDMFKNYFEKCETTVASKGSDTEVKFTYDGTGTTTVEEERGAFFTANEATITYTLTPHRDQAQGSNNKQTTNTIEQTLSAKTCHTLKFDVTDVGGIATITITLDDQTITTVDGGDIDINDDTYQPDDSGSGE